MEWQTTNRPGIYKAAGRRGSRYKVFWRDAGGKQLTKTFTSWQDALAKSNEVGHQRDRGELPDSSLGRMTLRELVDQVHAARTYAPATLDVHASCMARAAVLVNRELRDITPAGVEAVLASVEAPVMREKVRSFLSAMFRFAVDKRWVTSNPIPRPTTSQTRADRIQRRAQGGKARARKYLSDDELERLLEATSARWRTMVTLMSRMGLRPGEAYALTVGKFRPAADVPKQPPTLRVDTSITGFTKTGEPRELVLPDVVAQEVAAHVATFTDGEPDSAMFTNERGGAIAGKNAADAWRRRHFTPAVEASGIGPGFTPNALRHSAASFAIAHGANVYHVQRMLGHAKPSITLDVYGELWDSSLGELAERLDAAIREAAPGR